MIRTIEEAQAKVRAAWSKETLYIVLSESQYHDGVSIPRIFKIAEDHLSLSIFTAYSDAAAFCKQEGYLADGIPLIGRMESSDQLRDLYSVLNVALALGVNTTDLDCGTEDAIHLAIGAMLEWGGRKPEDVSVLLSKEALAQARISGKFPLKFNDMPVCKPEEEV